MIRNEPIYFVVAVQEAYLRYQDSGHRDWGKEELVTIASGLLR